MLAELYETREVFIETDRTVNEFTVRVAQESGISPERFQKLI